MKYQVKRKIGFLLVISMLIVMIYPGESGRAATQTSDGFYIDSKGVLISYNGSKNVVVIPDEVTTIGAGAFSTDSGATVTSIEIGENVKVIEERAFEYCWSLKRITIPTNVTKVGKNVFNGCEELGEIVWETSADIPEGAFKNCVSLKSVTLSEEISSIGDEAFKGCTQLPSFVVPKGTEGMGESVFDDCKNLRSIKVEEGNDDFSSYDGVLYRGDGLSVFCVPGGLLGGIGDDEDHEGLVLHDGATYIMKNAFYGTELGTVTVPESVTRIEDGAFNYSSIEKLIILGDGLEYFGAQLYLDMDGDGVPDEGSFIIDNIDIQGNPKCAEDIYDQFGSSIVTGYTPEEPDDSEDPGNSENPSESEGTENTENSETPDDSEDSGSTETPGNSEDSGSSENPSTQQPSTQQPSTQTPSTQQPSTQQPSTQQPSTQTPSTQQPSTQTPSTQTPSTQTPSTQTPSTQTQSTQSTESSTQSTQSTESSTQSTQQPSTQTQSTQQPSTQQPSTQTQSTQQPSTQSTESTQATESSEKASSSEDDEDDTESTPDTSKKRRKSALSLSASSNSSGSGGIITTSFEQDGTAYIAGNPSISGWSSIYTYMQAASNGSTIAINMNGTTVVPGAVLALAKEKDQILSLNMGNGISWTVEGRNITGGTQTDIDFGVTMGSGSVPAALQADVADDSWSTQMHLAYDGFFGLTALLTVNVGADKAGLNATLYYYNEGDQHMDFVDMAFVGTNGDVIFRFEHASDYVIVLDGYTLAGANASTGGSISNATMDGSAGTATTTPTTPEPPADAVEDTETTGTESGGATVVDTNPTTPDTPTGGDTLQGKDDTPATGQGLNAKYILCLGVMLMGIYMILTSRKPEYETA